MPKTRFIPYRGRPCKRGHKAARYRSTGACVACVKATDKLRHSGDGPAWVKQKIRFLTRVPGYAEAFPSSAES